MRPYVAGGLGERQRTSRCLVADEQLLTLLVVEVDGLRARAGAHDAHLVVVYPHDLGLQEGSDPAPEMLIYGVCECLKEAVRAFLAKSLEDLDVLLDPVDFAVIRNSDKKAPPIAIQERGD